MNRVFYKLTLNNSPTFYELPCKTDFVGLWEKNYCINEKYCNSMMDCTEENIVEQKLFKFYDNPPYKETKEQEEEYNKILSMISIVYNKELTTMREVNYNYSPLNIINETEIPSDNKLIISSVIIA